MKRIFDNQVNAIVTALEEILVHHKRASKVLAKIIQEHPKWGSRDRKTVYDFTFGILRWKILMNHQMGFKENAHKPLFWIALWAQKKGIEIPFLIEIPKINLNNKSKAMHPHVDISFPYWLHQIGQEELKEKWKPEAEALNKKAKISLRVNRLKTNPEILSKELKQKYNIAHQVLAEMPDTIILEKGMKMERQPLFKKGLFEIQDANSQKIAPFCLVKSGTNVIDFCAGAGGKTLHLAALMQNEGEILAFDVSANKLRELNKRAKSNGVNIVQSIPISSQTDFSPLHQWADTILIDAPCSGLGTLKRSPEIKWNLSLEHLNKMTTQQSELLKKAAPLLRSKGKLIYATCSILPRENEKQVEHFLKENPEFELEEQCRISPSETDFDGFFMARLVKK